MGELINGRTPEEIKDALMRCGRRHCKAESGDCPYYIDCLVGATRLKLMKDAFDYIRYLESERDAALAKVPKWISVKERLPEEVCRCLVITKRHEESSMVNTATYNHMGWWTHGNFGEVTHWMPLPSAEELK